MANAVAKINYNNIKVLSQAQPKYGVSIAPIHAQPKYGVVVRPPIVQPAYGVQVVHVPQDISITFDQLEENIAILKRSIATLKNSWNNETKRNINTLNNSWVGPDCASYTSKLTNMDSKVQNTIAALELLCSTYEQARDMVKDNQSKTLSEINAMN